MEDNIQPTSTRRNVLKKGAVTTALVAGGVTAFSGSAAATDYDGYGRVTGDGEYTVKLKVSNIDVHREGVYYDKSIQDGVWVLEGRVDGEPHKDPNDYAWFEFEGFEEFVSSESDEDVDVNITFY